MVRSRLKTVFACHQPNLYLSGEARVYDCGVGPACRPCFALRFDSPDDVADLLPQKCIVWGAKAKPPVSPQ